MRTRRIRSLGTLNKLAINRKAVHCPTLKCFSHYWPAAFAINLPGSLLLRLFDAGLYLYIKPKGKK